MCGFKDKEDKIVSLLTQTHIFIKKKKKTEISTLFEEEKHYYKPKRESNFRNNNYIEYESNDDRNRNLSSEEYLEKK